MYTICEKIGGTANIRLSKTNNEQYEMVFKLSQGTDRSILQEINPHIIFSDRYNNLLSFTYFTDTSVKKNYAYVLGKGEGEKRKRTTYFKGIEPSSLERYEVYIDAKDISDEEQENGETKSLSDAEYSELLKEKGKSCSYNNEIRITDCSAVHTVSIRCGLFCWRFRHRRASEIRHQTE